MIKDFLEAGRITNTHGVRGEVKFEHWCDSPEALSGVKILFLDDKGERPLHIRSMRKQNEFLLIIFDEITDMDEAKKYKNRTLFVKRSEIKLPEGRHFIADLIGLSVTDAVTGECYGKVRDVYNRGASDIYEVEKDSKVVLFPAAKEFIDRIDIENGIFVNPPKGLF